MDSFKKETKTDFGIFVLGLAILALSTSSVRAEQMEISKLCADLKKSVQDDLKWKIDPCEAVEWKQLGYSVQGRPLLYTEFGNPNAENSTLILSMVHSDEITPLYLGLRLVLWLKENWATLGTPEMRDSMRVVVAPLVNPDSFFTKPRKRVNARGVDINRNFLTADWSREAVKKWKAKYKSDPRRYPGASPRSEPETLFQEDLIRFAKPTKILSVHSPLNFMDYDGPMAMALDTFPKEYVHECLRLRQRLKATSGGFFPGSLGNYAGRELGIPTLTLELPSANPRQALNYWKKFQPGIRTMIEFKVPPGARPESKIQ